MQQEDILDRLRGKPPRRRKPPKVEDLLRGKPPEPPAFVTTQFRGQSITTFSQFNRAAWKLDEIERILEWHGEPLAFRLASSPYVEGRDYERSELDYLVYEMGAYNLLRSIGTPTAEALGQHLATEAVTALRSDDGSAAIFATTETPDHASRRIADEYVTRPHALPPELEARRLSVLSSMPQAFQDADRATASFLREAIRTPEQVAARLADLAAKVRIPHAPRVDWREELRVSRDGDLMATFTNLVEIFENGEFWQDPANHPQSPYRGTPGSRFAYNEMSDTPCILLEPLGADGKTVRGQYGSQSLTANHEEWFSWVRRTLGRVQKIDPDKYILWDAILYLSRQRAYHPVQYYLNSLTWDGAPYLHHLATEILGIEKPTPLQRRMLALWMISCVARAFEPGCKVDTVLVLQGDQGLYKSTFFHVLGGEWFVDSPMDMEKKDCFQVMAESWIYEWGEIGKLTRHRQAEVIKAFVTSREDTYRAPYERKPGRHPRSMVFVGTTNEDEFLVDRENRRFWVIPVTKSVNVTLLKEWRNQLWAEATAAYQQGPVDGLEPWVLRQEERKEHAESLEPFRPQDPWYGPLRDFVEKHEPTPKKPGFTMREILSGALQLDLKDFDKARQMRVSEILRELGYRRAQFGKDRLTVWVKA